MTSAALPALRGWWQRRGWAAEWEIAVPTLVVASSAMAVARLDPAEPAIAIAHIDGDGRGAAAALIILSAVLFLGKGGNLVVRGFLNRAGALPRFNEQGSASAPEWSGTIRAAVLQEGTWTLHVRQSSPDRALGNVIPQPVADEEEIGRGRLIGTLERTLLLLLALGANYTAVAFLITAKGLVRAKEFEKRDYAEYFLIGTLASTALALILGTLIRIALGGSWM